MNLLITGSSGFIGANLINSLKKEVNFIYGIDNHNDVVYHSKFKKFRSNILRNISNFKEYIIDLSHTADIEEIIKEKKIDMIIHLAAHPGVRLSSDNPILYVDNNINNFFNIINLAKKYQLGFIYASSSSVYNSKVNQIPFSENEISYNPDSIYGYTKYSNELIAKIYLGKYKFKSIGMRFFSVYGEMGRPDMAIMSFIYSLKNNKKIKLNNFGKTKRDYTSIKSVVDVIKNIIFKFEKLDNYFIFNIGNTEPIETGKILNFLIKLSKVKPPNIEHKRIVEQISTFADMKRTELILGKTLKYDIYDELPNIYNWVTDNNYF